MSARSFWDDRFTMLMACASPGSAWAYHLGLATFEAGLLRRDKATDGGPAPAGDATQAANDVTALIKAGRVIALP
jgi:hypothetical protein